VVCVGSRALDSPLRGPRCAAPSPKGSAAARRRRARAAPAKDRPPGHQAVAVAGQTTRSPPGSSRRPRPAPRGEGPAAPNGSPPRVRRLPRHSISFGQSARWRQNWAKLVQAAGRQDQFPPCSAIAIEDKNYVRGLWQRNLDYPRSTTPGESNRTPTANVVSGDQDQTQAAGAGPVRDRGVDYVCGQKDGRGKAGAPGAFSKTDGRRVWSEELTARCSTTISTHDGFRTGLPLTLGIPALIAEELDEEGKQAASGSLTGARCRLAGMAQMASHGELRRRGRGSAEIPGTPQTPAGAACDGCRGAPPAIGRGRTRRPHERFTGAARSFAPARGLARTCFGGRAAADENACWSARSSAGWLGQATCSAPPDLPAGRRRRLVLGHDARHCSRECSPEDTGPRRARRSPGNPERYLLAPHAGAVCGRRRIDRGRWDGAAGGVARGVSPWGLTAQPLFAPTPEALNGYKV